MHNLMVDIETLGNTGSDVVVISIGACFFDDIAGEIGAKFSMNLDIADQLKTRVVDAGTLKWWMTQSDAAKKVFSEAAAPTDLVLKTFVAWVVANASVDQVRPWGNGSSFDISIMEDILRQYRIEVPWKFYNVYDLRTFRQYVGKGAKVDKIGVEHNALDDAISQAMYVIKYSNIKNKELDDNGDLAMSLINSFGYKYYDKFPYELANEYLNKYPETGDDV